MSSGANALEKWLRYVQIIVFTSLIFYFGRILLIPLFYGLLLAMILYPFCKWLETHKWPRSLAITVGILIVVVLFGALIWLLILQLNIFWTDWPELKLKVRPALGDLQRWLERSFNISTDSQSAWINKSLEYLNDNALGLARQAFSSVTETFFILLMVPVFTALFLYNRGDFIIYLRKAIPGTYRDKIDGIVLETVHTYSRFIKGMIMVYLIVGLLNSLGLLALGIQHAFLFGFITAVMTIIPYVGIIVSALIPISVAWITKDSLLYPLGVVLVFSFVQYLEANVIFPRVVGVQINVSTIVTLVAVIVGGLLWGVSGMILFIPFVAILKIISDYIPGWEPLNILLSRRGAGRKR